MVTVIDPGTHTAAVIASLELLGFPVGDNEAPPPLPSGAQDLPYCVVYSIEPEPSDGPMNDPNADQILTYQVTTVGETREQAQALSNKVRAQMLNGPELLVAGRKILSVQLGFGNAVERDDDVRPPLFYGIDSFDLWSTPA